MFSLSGQKNTYGGGSNTTNRATQFAIPTRFTSVVLCGAQRHDECFNSLRWVMVSIISGECQDGGIIFSSIVTYTIMRYLFM